VIHRTFRSLDEAPKLVGFTLRQWAVLIAGASAVLGLVYLLHLPTKAAITLSVFTIGLPTALTYVSESGGLQLGVLLADMCRWRRRTHLLSTASPETARARGLLVLAPSDDRDLESPGPIEDASLEDLFSVERWG
jgi:hypothetical protein